MTSLLIEKGVKRDRRPWTAEADAHLRKFWAEGKTDVDIGYILDRHPKVICVHRQSLGLPANSKGGLPKGHLTHTEEAKAKSGAAARQRWADPEYRARMLPHLRRATAASMATRIKPPKRGTPEYRDYRKIRENLGPHEAHKLLMASPAP
jgi:hypothetical protein